MDAIITLWRSLRARGRCDRVFQRDDIGPGAVRSRPKGTKVAVVLHLYYTDLWREFQRRLRNVTLALGDERVDLFVTLSEAVKDQSVRSAILRAFPAARVEVVPNRGMDIGPFLLWIQNAYASGRADEYSAVLKLHTKKSLYSIGQSRGSLWRNGLADAVAGTPAQVGECLRLLDSTSVGMVGYGSALSRFTSTNEGALQVLSAWLGVPKGDGRFFAGTMFWVRMSVLRRFLTPEILPKLYECMPERYSTDGTAAHGLERIFSYMVPACGYELAGVTPPAI